MKIAEKIGNVVTSNVDVSHTFKIKPSRKAFEILSSGIYSDKVKAIIRELSTNAADAHVAAGKKDLPFEVHLPNNFEPWFSVKDFGTGLSENDILHLYTTYFESNKTNSNDYTGCLGLGSKSPFCYTDSFSVISRFHGKKLTFNCFINAEGIPCPVKMGEENTDEDNGLEVKFSVKREDFSEFYQKAATVLATFVIPPTIVGNSHVKLNQKSYSMKSDFYGYHGEYNCCQVIMGNVAYALDVYNLGISYDLKDMMMAGINLFLPIGAVSIAADREKLSYDNDTKNTLKDIVNKVHDHLKKEFSDKLNDAKNIWEARQLIVKNRGMISKLSLGNLLTWNGQQISEVIQIPNDVFLAQIVKNRRSTARHFQRTINTERLTNEVVYFNDLTGTGVYSRIKHNLKDYEKCYLLTGKDAEKFLKDNCMESIVKNVSTLPAPPKMPRASKGQKARNVKLWEFINNNSSSYNPDMWNEAEVDIAKDKGYYVLINRYQVKYSEKNNSYASSYNLKTDLERFRTLGIDVDNIKIIGIKEKQLAKVKKYGWKSLAELKEEIIQKFNNLKNDAPNVITNVSYTYERWAAYQGKFISKLLNDFTKKIKDVRKLASDKKVLAYYDLIEDKNSVKEIDLDSDWNAIVKIYPMLSFVDHPSNDIKSINQYTNLVDGN